MNGPPLALLVGHVGSGRTTALDILTAELAREAIERPHAPLVIRLCADDLANEHDFYAALRNLVGDDQADAVLLALRYGQCIALIDDADRSEWLARAGLPDQLLRGALKFVGADSPRSRALVAWSPALPQNHVNPAPNLRLAPLTSEPAGVRELRADTVDALRFTLCVHRLARARPAYFDRAWVARLSAEPQQRLYALAAEAFAAYLHAWAERAALWTPGRSCEFFLAFAEAVARSLWRREPGVAQGKVPWPQLAQRFPELKLPLSCEHESVAWLLDGTVMVRGDQAVAPEAHDTEAWLDGALRAERDARSPDPSLWERDAWRLNQAPGKSSVQFAFPGLLDFLLARSVVAGLSRGDCSTLDLPRLSPVVLNFIREDPAWSRIRGEVESILLADPVPRVSENALFIALRDPSLRSSAEAPWKLPRARLQATDLFGAPLEHANLDEADLERSELRDAQLGGARLRRAILRQARLHGADLRQARCEGADFTAAWLDGARLQGADLRRAILSASTATAAAVQLDSADLAGTRRWAAMWNVDTAGSLQDGSIIGPGECLHLYDIAWSPAIEAPVLAAGTRGGYVCLIEPHRGRIYARWLAHPHGPVRVAFSHDGQFLASFVEGRPGVRLWRIADDTEIVSPPLNAISAKSLAWAKHHSRLVVFTGESSPLVVDVSDQVARRLGPGPRNCHGGAFVGDDHRIVAFTEHDPRLLEWDLHAAEQSPSEIETLPGGDNVEGLTASSDGQRLIVSGVGKSRLVERLANFWRFSADLGRSTWRGIAQFAPSGSMACVLDDHGSLILKSLHAPPKSLKLSDEQRRIHMIEATSFSGDGTMVAGLEHSGDLYIWDTRTGRLKMSLAAEYMGGCAVVLDPSRAELRIGCHGSLRWVENGEPHPTHRSSVRGGCLAFSESDALALIGGDDLTLHDLTGAQPPTLLAAPDDSSGRWHDAAFSDDGTILWACKSGGNGLYPWRFAGERPIPGEKIGSADVSVLAWATVGQDVACLARDRRPGVNEALLLVETGGTRRRHVLHGEEELLQYRIAISRDGLALVSQFGDVYVRGRDDLAAPPRWRRTPGSRDLGALAFSPAGDILAIAAGTRVELYDARSGASVAVLPGHERVPFGIRWTTNRLLTWTSDTIRIWHPEDFSLLGTVHVVKNGVVLATSTGYSVIGEASLAQFHVQRGWDCVPLATLSQLRHEEADMRREFSALFGTNAAR